MVSSFPIFSWPFPSILSVHSFADVFLFPPQLSQFWRFFWIGLWQITVFCRQPSSKFFRSKIPRSLFGFASSPVFGHISPSVGCFPFGSWLPSSTCLLPLIFRLFFFRPPSLLAPGGPSPELLKIKVPDSLIPLITRFFLIPGERFPCLRKGHVLPVLTLAGGGRSFFFFPPLRVPPFFGAGPPPFCPGRPSFTNQSCSFSPWTHVQPSPPTPDAFFFAPPCARPFFPFFL